MTSMKRAGALAATIALGALALNVSAAQAQAPPDAGPGDARFAATTLAISAEGETRVAPDMATLTLGVARDSPTAAQAMAETNAAMARVIDAVKGAGIDARQIQTSSLTLSPQFAYLPNQPPKLKGYEASNQVSVTVLDLTRVGPVADAATAAGATNIDQISFGLRSRTSAENAARLAAVKALEDKAAIYADATGYHIKRLVSLREASFFAPAPVVVTGRMQALAAAAPTPVETGELTVTVSVTGEFELTH